MDIQELAEKVFLKRPGLKKILAAHGTESLLQYSSGHPINNHIVAIEKKREFAKTVGREAKRLLGDAVSDDIEQQLMDYYYVSTADHHGPISHPYFAHSNMLAGLPENLQQRPNNKYWLVLACSTVSLNNSSYPRGVQFHTVQKNALVLKSFPFFSQRYKHMPVFGLLPFQQDAIGKFRDYLYGTLQKRVSAHNVEKVVEAFGNQAVKDQINYSDQITLINKNLFRLFFSNLENPLELIYLNQEKITIALLLDFHLHSQTEIHQLLFNPEYTQRLEELLSGLPGAELQKKGKGTVLFWGFDPATKQRFRLFRNRDSLVSDRGDFEIALHPEAIEKGLTEGRLMPTMLLNLFVTAGYYGVKCLGGFSQTTYLTEMMKAYRELFFSEHTVETEALFGDFIFADIQSGNESAAITGMDIALFSDKFNYKKFQELCNTITLSQSMNRVMPLLYKMVYPNEASYSWPNNAYKADFSINPAFANSAVFL